MPMAAPKHVDHQPAAGASSSSSEKAAGGGHNDDPSVTPDDRDPTRRLLVEMMLAGTALGVPMAAPNPVDQRQAAAMAAAAASVSAATAGRCPGVAPDGDDHLTLALAEAFATATLEGVAGDGVPVPCIRASPADTPAAEEEEKPWGSHAAAERRQARRRTRLRLVRVPTDYLRAGQESRDRRRRRELARRCVGRLFSIHEDRARERGISAMTTRLTTTTTLESASGRGGDGGDDATVSAAAPSLEHAGLAELLEKMALKKQH